MSFKLPTADGASAILWSHDDDGIGERFRVECHDGDRWSLLTEVCELGEWTHGSLCLDAYSEAWMDFAFALRPHAIGVHQLIEFAAKGRAEVPDDYGSVTLVRVTGKDRWTASWTNDGTNTRARPMLRLTHSRPLIADEMLVMINRIIGAIESYDRDAGE